MPGGNRTGPMGRGPMTGRGAGICAGTGISGNAHRGLDAFEKAVDCYREAQAIFQENSDTAMLQRLETLIKQTQPSA